MRFRGGTLGKRKIMSEEEVSKMVLIVANDVLGVAEKMTSRIFE